MGQDCCRLFPNQDHEFIMGQWHNPHLSHGNSYPVRHIGNGYSKHVLDYKHYMLQKNEVVIKYVKEYPKMHQFGIPRHILLMIWFCFE